jgi:hypothetical protein
VGIATADRHPVTEAIDGWLHNVFTVFAAMAIPQSDLAQRVHLHEISNGTRTADVFYGALAIRDFGGLSDDVKRTAADRPPTMVVVEELFNGYALPDQPFWLYTFCASLPNGPITEVTLLNGDASDGFARIADHLPWEGHGSVKSWALIAPR